MTSFDFSDRSEMNKFECSPAKPWGIHPEVRNDEDCPRCGWTAPGRPGSGGWTVIEGGAESVAAAPEARAA